MVKTDQEQIIKKSWRRAWATAWLYLLNGLKQSSRCPGWQGSNIRSTAMHTAVKQALGYFPIFTGSIADVAAFFHCVIVEAFGSVQGCLTADDV
jgi:hypothetical protein